VPKGILLVQSRPASSSPDDVDAYHRWYDEAHIPEILALDGFTAARRLRTLDGESFLALYEVDDVEVAKAALTTAQSSGAMTRPAGVQLDPPPSVQWCTDLHDPA
jgi:hypothetical protein